METCFTGQVVAAAVLKGTRLVETCFTGQVITAAVLKGTRLVKTDFVQEVEEIEISFKMLL